jgi:hypothetical protein
VSVRYAGTLEDHETPRGHGPGRCRSAGRVGGLLPRPGLGGVGAACDTNRHQLVATVLLRNGGTVDCFEPESHPGAGSGYRDITLICDEKLLLSDVESVLLDPQD